jgi:hypothetical protein
VPRGASRTTTPHRRALAAPAGDQPFEQLEIELARVDPETVARSLGGDPVLPEQPAERVHLHLERVRGRRRRALVPERVDQPVAGDDLPGGEEQTREQPRLPPRAERDGTAVADDLQRPENEKFRLPALRPPTEPGVSGS